MSKSNLLAIGLASGLAAGLLGIGGGALMVPLLVSVVGLTQRQAHAVSLGAVIPLALAAAVTYGIADQVRLTTATALFVGGVVGAPVGARLLATVDDRLARRAFGLLLLATSIYLFAS